MHTQAIPILNIEPLPFKIKIASPEELAQAIGLRARAYGRHVPELGEKMLAPDPLDVDSNCSIFVAVSKLDGSVLGTMRSHLNASAPLPLEASVSLPEQFQGKRLAEATRLSIDRLPDSITVRSALFKAFFLHAMEQGVKFMVVSARSPVDRIYAGLQFQDVFEPGVFHPMSHVAGLPHRVMSLDIGVGQEGLRGNPLYEHVFLTLHPDIDITEARDIKWPAGRSNHKPCHCDHE